MANYGPGGELLQASTQKKKGFRAGLKKSVGKATSVINKTGSRIKESFEENPLENILTLGAYGAVETGLETLGDIGSKTVDQFREDPAPGVLAIDPEAEAKEIENKKKKLQQSVLRNSPGIREQSVLNLRG